MTDPNCQVEDKGLRRRPDQTRPDQSEAQRGEPVGGRREQLRGQLRQTGVPRLPEPPVSG